MCVYMCKSHLRSKFALASITNARPIYRSRSVFFSALGQPFPIAPRRASRFSIYMYLLFCGIGYPLGERCARPRVWVVSPVTCVEMKERGRSLRAKKERMSRSERDKPTGRNCSRLREILGFLRGQSWIAADEKRGRGPVSRKRARVCVRRNSLEILSLSCFNSSRISILERVHFTRCWLRNTQIYISSSSSGLK